MISRQVIELVTGTAATISLSNSSNFSLGWSADSTGSTYSVEASHDGSHFFTIQASGTADTNGTVTAPIRKIRLNVTVDAGQVTLSTTQTEN